MRKTAVENSSFTCGLSVGRPGFIRGVAQLFKGAIHAFWLASYADLAAVVD